jgi:hypothetical protein
VGRGEGRESAAYRLIPVPWYPRALWMFCIEGFLLMILSTSLKMLGAWKEERPTVVLAYHSRPQRVGPCRRAAGEYRTSCQQG